MKVFTVAEMVALEQDNNQAGLSYDDMMENAGKAVADAIAQRIDVTYKSVMVLVGTGNNGGDGLVAGRYLAEMGADVLFYLFKPREAETDKQYAQVQEMGLQVLEADFDMQQRLLYHRLQISDVVVDALLGAGLSRPVQGNLARLMRRVQTALQDRKQSKPSTPSLWSIAGIQPSPTAHHPPLVVAVDCPSGLHCTTGALDPLTIEADMTVTFAGTKRGHHLWPGAAACGEVVVADIGFDEQLPAYRDIAIELMTYDKAQAWLPKRPLAGHKGTFGTALICAGQAHYWGAPVLAGRAALRAGAGLVSLVVPEAIRAAVATHLPEAVYPPVPDQKTLGTASWQAVTEDSRHVKAVLVGPGIGQATSLMEALLATKDGPPLVVDADGLNLLATMSDWYKQLPANTILTPHPGEMARLCGHELPADRISLAQEKAQAWGHVVVLKGAYTIIAAPDGQVQVLPFANPALAVAGSGDVLAGIIVALLAQGLSPFEAAALGGYWHGAAGERWVQGKRPAGLLAREIADQLPAIFR